jgi:hypothetical protein
MGILISRPVEGHLQFESLPNEVIMHVFSYLKFADLLNCGLVSKRFRAISNLDQYIIWPKTVNLRNKKVPVEFLQKLLDSGCKYLSLSEAILEGTLNLPNASDLLYLNLSGFRNNENSEKMLKSSHSLQKLSLSRFHLSANLIRIISLQYGKTLMILDLSKCTFCKNENICTDPDCSYTVPIKQIVNKCTELTELSLHSTSLREASVDILVSNLTSKIEKLDLFDIFCLKDEHVKKLVTRCNKITDLNLGGRTSITKRSLNFVIEHLRLTLVKLDLKFTHVEFNVLKLKRMEKLKYLCYNNKNAIGGYDDHIMLKNQLPNLTITASPDNAKIVVPIHPRYNFGRGFWEIKAEQEENYLVIIVNNFVHLSIADYDDNAFEAGTLACTFLESRSMTVENLYILPYACHYNPRFVYFLPTF